MQALIRLIESNAKAIEAQGSQQAIDREQFRLDREADREQARLDRELARISHEENQEDFRELRQLIESNAKAIEAAGNQQAADQDLFRADRERSQSARDEMRELSRQTTEEMREMSRQTREEISALTTLVRESRENSLIQEREIRMQAGEIQNLADSIQVLYSRQPPQSG
jgi:hypothetical protein